MNCLAKAMNSVYHTHSDTSDNCRGDFIFPDISKTQYGLGTVLIVQCTLCNVLCVIETHIKCLKN